MKVEPSVFHIVLTHIHLVRDNANNGLSHRKMSIAVGADFKSSIPSSKY